ncbi:P18 [Operophtera brumata nucleopolyhedrovirus]|uniref:P18 n=1 Tax=Operophtera brumata nucleopolyhedrovirus TaxID=1046267 RepID=A0A2H4UZW4_9ABAC|nr:P18 [Operophtera brumata nucleopolyhedrovirus]AUA60309.1 P18 [Operophtera brumata nucleopolyhedrovirus]
MNTIQLFLFTPHDVENDKPDYGNDTIYFEAINESVFDASCDKYSLFAELKKEEALFMKKTYDDLVHYFNGNFYKNHVLLDALVMYKTNIEEHVDNTAFGKNILDYCENFIVSLFQLFRLQSKIIVLLPRNHNLDEDNLSALLKRLSDQSIIQIKTI